MTGGVVHVIWLLGIVQELAGISLHGSLRPATGERRITRRSTDTVQITGQPEQGYTIDIYLGTPSQQFSVVVDTGSANFALSGSTQSGISTYFQSSVSTTYQDGSVSDMTVQYFNGSWTGFLGSDMFKFCKTCEEGRVDVALIATSSMFFVNETVYQGVLGLAYQSIIRPYASAAQPVLDSLVAAGKVDTAFNIRLCGKVHQNSTQLNGDLEFVQNGSATANSGYTYTDIVKEWFYQIEILNVKVDNVLVADVDCTEYNSPAAFLDSGTTNVILPTKAYMYVYTAIQEFALKHASGVPDASITNFMDRLTFLCFDTSSAAFDIFPELHFTIAHNTTHQFTVNLPSQQYIRQTWDSMQQQFKHNKYCYRFGIEGGNSGTILGAAFMEQMDILHDRNNSKIGFKVAQDCQVSDPVFTKVISAVSTRSGEGSCILQDSNSLRYAALALLILAILVILPLLLCLDSVRAKFGRCFDLIKSKVCPCLIVKYEYMMNSESSIDEIGLNVLSEQQSSLLPDHNEFSENLLEDQ